MVLDIGSPRMTMDDDICTAINSLRKYQECGWTVTSDWEEGPCPKKPTTLIQYEWEGETLLFTVCTYHAHRNSDAVKIPLLDIINALEGNKS